MSDSEEYGGEDQQKVPNRFETPEGNASADSAAFGGEFTTHGDGGTLTTEVGSAVSGVNVCVSYDLDDVYIGALATYSPDEAREMASTLQAAADRWEDNR